MSYQAGFITFPGGGLAIDPRGAFYPSPSDGPMASVEQPVLRSGGGASIGYYDRAFHRWLPSDRIHVSPDESRYAFWGEPLVGPGVGGGTIHVVDVATGRDHTLNVPAADYRILEFGHDGIYFRYGWQAGLWLMDPDTGSIRQLFKDGWVGAVSGGFAWVMASDQDPHPTTSYPSSEIGPPNPAMVNVLQRRDLSSGSVETWLDRPGFNVFPLASFGSQILVWINQPLQPPPQQGLTFFHGLMLVSGPGSAVAFAFIQPPSVSPWQETAYAGLGFADANGIWLGGDAIYLYTAKSGIRKVAAVPGFPSTAACSTPAESTPASA